MVEGFDGPHERRWKILHVFFLFFCGRGGGGGAGGGYRFSTELT